MPFFKSFSEKAGPPDVFTAHRELYGLWSEMSELLMNGHSPLSPAERELILAFAAGIAECRFVYVAHSQVAYEWGLRKDSSSNLLMASTRHPSIPGFELCWHSCASSS